MAIWKGYNGAKVTTGIPAPIALTAATLKTLIQFKPGATTNLKIKAWGYSLDGFALALPGSIELVETDVAATVTAFVTGDLYPQDPEALLGALDPVTALIAVGTAASGFTASAEGSITATRQLGHSPQLASPMQTFVERFPLGEEPVISNGKFGRIRAKFAAGVNILCWMDVMPG